MSAERATKQPSAANQAFSAALREWLGEKHALQARIFELERALEPFAKIAGPIKGEAGRPTYLDAIMKGETEELAVTTIFDTGGRGAVLWADDFRAARAALPTAGDRS